MSKIGLLPYPTIGEGLPEHYRRYLSENFKRTEDRALNKLGDVMRGRLIIPSPGDPVSGNIAKKAASPGGPLVIGTFGGDSLEFDNNEVQAFDVNGNPGQLLLNREGGTISIGAAGPTDVNINGKLTAQAYAIVDIIDVNTNVPTHTWTHIIFNGNSIRNDGGWASGPNGGLVVPVDGWYQGNATLAYPNNTGGGARYVRIGPSNSGNGSDIKTMGTSDRPSGAGTMTVSTSGAMYLSAGDEMGVWAWHDQGNTLSVGNFGSTDARFSLVRIGG